MKIEMIHIDELEYTTQEEKVFLKTLIQRNKLWDKMIISDSEAWRIYGFNSALRQVYNRILSKFFTLQGEEIEALDPQILEDYLSWGTFKHYMIYCKSIDSHIVFVNKPLSCLFYSSWYYTWEYFEKIFTQGTSN